MSNLFSASKIFSSVELTKGYSTFLIGIPSSAVFQELLDAHMHQCAARAIEILLSSRTSGTVSMNEIKEGDDLWVFYCTSSHAKKKRWVKAKVVEIESHRILA